MLRDRFQLRGRVQSEDEDLVFIDSRAFIRKAAHDRRPPGAELEALPAFERLAVERGQPRFDREAAAYAGGKIAIEVVYPVLRIGPAALTLFDAVDRERIDLARIAERHHRRGEARGDLSHTLDRPLRRKEFDRLRRRACRN